MAKDIKLTPDFDLDISSGDIVFDDSEMQEVAIILRMSQGELKSDPMIGANLIQFMRGIKDPVKLEKHIRTQLSMDDKDYDEIKHRLKYE